MIPHIIFFQCDKLFGQRQDWYAPGLPPYENKLSRPRRQYPRHHHGWRSGNTPLSAHEGPLQTRRAARRQIPPGGHPRQQLHQLRVAAHLRPDAIQQHLAAPAHQRQLQVRHVLPQLRRNPRRAADARRLDLVPGHRGRRPPEPARLPPAALRILHHPERRPALPDGLPPPPGPARQEEGRHHHRHHPRRTRRRHGLRHHAQRRAAPIFRFEEKPKTDALLKELRIPPTVLKELGRGESDELYQASIGIYIFNRDVLIEALDNEFADFGKHIIPKAIKDYTVCAYIFQGYWEDIGTIRAFFDANLNLTDRVPAYSFFDTENPVYTHARFLPASKVNAATLKQVVISDGCIISDAHLERCVIGVRSYVDSGTTLRHCIVMGSDFYEVDMASKEKHATKLGIGKNCTIDHAIIDKNARIGDNVVISPEGKPANFDGENYYIRDGIVIVPKNAVIPTGSWI